MSDRTISKWETGAGSPEVSVLSDLALVFGVRVEALLQGEQPVNRVDQGNLRRLQFYLCPTCGNILTATGPACVSCCGRVLSPCAVQKPDEAHAVIVERVEDEDYITFSHEMTKAHHLLFFCAGGQRQAAAAPAVSGAGKRDPAAAPAAQPAVLLLQPGRPVRVRACEAGVA